jgi:Tfp pilus assembly protein PilN
MAEKYISSIALRRQTVEWTTLREKKGAPDVVDHCLVALEVPPGTDPSSPEMAAELKAKAGRMRGTPCLSVASEQTLLRVAILPSTDVTEIRGMAELQVDKFAPFPLEHMAIAIEILSQTENQSRVLIAAVQKTHVETLGALFKKAGIAAEHVDVEIMGWWCLLRDKGTISDRGREVLLVIDEHSTELIVSQDGLPMLFRSLGSHKHLSPAESAAEIAEEVNYTLTTLESEWGVGAAGPIRVWHGESVGEDFLTQLRTSCTIPVDPHPLGDLPPLSEGLARRAFERSGTMLDLAPPEWRASTRMRHARKMLFGIMGVFLTLWVAAAATGITMYELQKGRVAAAKAAMVQLQKPSDDVKQLQKQVHSLERYGDRTYSAIECLREICTILPPGLDLDQFTYKKYGTVNLRGEADSSDPIYDFFKALEKSKLFTQVKPEGVTSSTRNNRQRSQFKVTCVLPEEKP